MGVSRIGELFQVGIDVLRTKLSEASKKIIAQTGSVVGKTTDSDNVEWWQHVGFASRPSAVEAGKQAAQAVVMRQGGREVAIASQDLRGLSIYGALADGETCIYATGADGTAQARILLKANGSINLYTVQGNAAGGKSMGIFIHPDGSINLAAPSGNAILVGDDGSVKLFNGSGGIQVKADGNIKVAGSTQLALSAGSVAIGGPSGLPIAIGPNVVTATSSLQTEITSVNAAVTALAAWAAAIQADPTHVAASSLIGAVGTTSAAATAATTAGAVSVTAANAIIPSLRTTSD